MRSRMRPSEVSVRRSVAFLFTATAGRSSSQDFSRCRARAEEHFSDFEAPLMHVSDPRRRVVLILDRFAPVSVFDRSFAERRPGLSTSRLFRGEHASSIIKVVLRNRPPTARDPTSDPIGTAHACSELRSRAKGLQETCLSQSEVWERSGRG